MALQLSLSHQSWSSTNPITSPDPTRSSVSRVRSARRVELGGNRTSSCNGVVVTVGKLKKREKGGERMRVKVRGSLDTVGVGETETLAGKVTEVNQDTFWPIVHSSGDKLVVLDMYTQWCGPCKVMAPKFQQLAEKHLDVIFLKLDCNQENKTLAKELGIRVVPTFKILKAGKIVEEVTGAKLDNLIAAIEAARSS